ncbi:MAG TPA: type II secretion system F family protein [Candidatus Angelobacter sp.]|jgi:pilus assembly protein TadC|nr:type II secretion system F family protein [Candidatus Angelobacter sp.]
MLASLCAVAAVLCLAAALPARRRRALPVELARVSTMDAREAARHRDAQRPPWERMLQPAVAIVATRLRPTWAGLGDDDLRRAGIDVDRFGVAELLTVKVLGGMSGLAAGLALAALAPGAAILLPGLAFGGFVAPSVVVTRRRAWRQARMLRELPDLVSLLKAFVGAGIPLEQALHLISAQLAGASQSNLLAAEVRRALSDYGLGMSIDEALHAMATRTGVPELEMLAAALSQAKRQGAGMERVLRDQETIARMQQRNRALAAASRVSTRLVGVLVMVYLPEFLVLILAPLFYGIFLRAFG